jgi:predicted MFS family arabinose efflux permease
MGIGTILGGYFSGIISDKIKLRKSGYLLILFYLLSCGLTFIAS